MPFSSLGLQPNEHSSASNSGLGLQVASTLEELKDFLRDRPRELAAGLPGLAQRRRKGGLGMVTTCCSRIPCETMELGKKQPYKKTDQGLTNENTPLVQKIQTLISLLWLQTHCSSS